MIKSHQRQDRKMMKQLEFYNLGSDDSLLILITKYCPTFALIINKAMIYLFFKPFDQRSINDTAVLQFIKLNNVFLYPPS